MSDLTAQKLLDLMKSLPPAPPDPFGFRGLFGTPRPRFAGLDIYDAPPPVPKIQVDDIKLSDGTPLLPAAFRLKINVELAERFGYRDDPFTDKVYLLGNYGLVCRPEYRKILSDFGA